MTNAILRPQLLGGLISQYINFSLFRVSSDVFCLSHCSDYRNLSLSSYFSINLITNTMSLAVWYCLFAFPPFIPSNPTIPLYRWNIKSSRLPLSLPSCLQIESMSPQTPRATNAPRLPALISYRHGINHRLVSIGGDQWAMYDPVRRELRLKRTDARKAFAGEQEPVKGEKWLPRNSRRIAKVSCGMLTRGKNGAGRKWLWPEVTADTVKFRFQVHQELRLLLAQGSEILSEESS